MRAMPCFSVVEVGSRVGGMEFAGAAFEEQPGLEPVRRSFPGPK